MECPIQTQENAEVLLAYSARKLEPSTAATLERHIDQCAACREFRDAQRLVWTALDAWEAMPVSPDFDRRLYGRIEEREHAGWWSRLAAPAFTMSWRPALPLTAACLIVAAVFLARTPATFDPPPPAHVETVDIEQVEKTLDDMDMLKQLYVAPRGDAAPKSM